MYWDNQDDQTDYAQRKVPFIVSKGLKQSSVRHEEEECIDTNSEGTKKDKELEQRSKIAACRLWRGRIKGKSKTNPKHRQACEDATNVAPNVYKHDKNACERLFQVRYNVCIATLKDRYGFCSNELDQRDSHDE